IDALVQEGMSITLWYPPGVTAKELIAAADRSRPLHAGDIYNAFAGSRPFTLPNANGEPSKGDYAPVLVKWPADGGEVTLMKDGETFVAAVPGNPNPGYM